MPQIAVRDVGLTDLTDLVGVLQPRLVPGIGAIAAKYTALGGAGGFLGAAAGGHSPTPGGTGWFRHFQGGSIYWSAETGAHEVHGAIREKWAAFGWERSFLGFPVTDETTTPDGVGRFNHFQGGSVYWSPATGAREVHGSIRDKWAQLGWERSFLGYPVSDETPTGDGIGRFSDFQHGQITWSPSLGAAVSFTTFDPVSAGPGIRPLGVSGDGRPDVRRRLVCSAHMDLTDHETFGSNEHSSADAAAEAVLTSDLPQDVLKMSDGAGGEMRVELTLVGQARISGDVFVQGTVVLFEGTSEGTTDRDGDESFTVLVPRDGFISRTITVMNEDEGDDKGVVAMTFSNFAV